MAASGRWAGTPAAAVGSEHHELFITYAQADRAWVYGFMLPALGLAEDRVITAEQFRPGAPVVDEFERAVTTSRYTVVVVSNAYLADAWSTFGEQLTSYASVGGADRLIPAVLEPCELPLRVEFRVRLDLTDESRWEEQLARLRDLLERSDPRVEDLPCPYPGMQVFTQDQAQWFYGREQESEQLLRRLRQQSLVVVIGPSGAGKSSLVFAGVLPRLGVSRPNGERWVMRSLRPGAHPTQALAAALETDGGEPAAGQRASEVGQAVAGLLAREGARRLLLVVDQLEEVFAQAGRAEQTAFFDRLLMLRDDARCVLLVTVRADFYAELMTCLLWPLGPGERFEVVPLAGEALARAVQQPAADVGVHLQSELVQRLVDDAADEPGVLPFVQETLVLLWHQRQRRLLTEAAYERLGGEGRSALTAAIAEKADATVSALTPRQRAIARRILLRLVQLGEGRQDTRRQEPVEALHSAADAQSEFEATLQHLTANRLLTLSGQESEQPRVDLAHEALITGWPQLHDWIRDNRDNLRMQRATFEDAQHWDEFGRDPEALYRGARLEAAGTWADTHHDELNDLERDFIQASREDAAARKRRQRRTTLLLRGLSGFLLLAFVAALYQWDDARSKAQENQRLASRYLALEAGAFEDWFGTEAFSADGSVLAVVDMTHQTDAIFGAVSLWNVDSGQATSLRIGDADALATSVAFSRDGSRVAWAYARDGDGQIVVWDLVNDWQVIDPIGQRPGYVFNLTFSEDGRSLVWEERKRPWETSDIVLWDLEAAERRNPQPRPDRLSQNFGSLMSLSADGIIAQFDIYEYTDLPSIVFWDVARSQAIGEPVGPSDLGQYTNWEDIWIDVHVLNGGTTAVISPRGSLKMGQGDVTDVFLWDIRERERHDLEDVGLEDVWWVAGSSSDGQTLFVEQHEGGRVLVLDIASGNLTEQLNFDTDGEVVALDADRSLAAVATYTASGEVEFREVAQLAVWDVLSGKQVGRSLSLDSSDLPIDSIHELVVRLNPIGTTHAIKAIYYGDDEEAVQEQHVHMLWDAATGQHTMLAERN